jgi:hypothetical protein
MCDWISVDKRLPAKGGYYIVCWIYGDSCVSGEVWFDGERWIHPDYSGDAKDDALDPPVIRYWMPIPLPPIELVKEIKAVDDED